MITELDRGRDELRIVVDEQAVTWIQAEQVAASRVHPRIRLVTPEDLGDDETCEVLLDVVAPSPAEARRLLTAIAPKAAAALAKA